MDKNNKWVQKNLNYTFNDPGLLIQALTHRSYSSENYERLEFLGDAVLDTVLSEILFKEFSDVEEGSLSRMRAHLVNQNTLADIARNLELNEYLILGKGERVTGKDRNSILSVFTTSVLQYSIIQYTIQFNEKFNIQCPP